MWYCTRLQMDADTRRAAQDMVDIIWKCANGETNVLSWFATRLIDSWFEGFKTAAYNRNGVLVADREVSFQGS